MKALRVLGWIALALALAAAWSAYRGPAFVGEWMSLLAACFN